MNMVLYDRITRLRVPETSTISESNSILYYVYYSVFIARPIEITSIL